MTERRRGRRLAAVLLLALSAGGPADAASPRFRAGATRCDITPPIGMPLVGSVDPAPARRVHDPLRARSPFRDTRIIALANAGHEYLPTPGRRALGGYETWLGPRHFAPDSTLHLVPAVLGLLAEIKPGASSGDPDPVAARAGALLRQVLADAGAGWSRIHAAEALVAVGAGAEVRQRLNADLAAWEASAQRAGVWRVLAGLATSPGERRFWLDRLETVALDPTALDRLQAVESLGKVGVGVEAPARAAIRAWAGTLPRADALFPLWVLHLSGDATAAPRFAAAFRDADPVLRRRAAFVCRRLPALPPGVHIALETAVRAEPPGSAVRPYLLAAALTHGVAGDEAGVSWAALETEWRAAPPAARVELAQALLGRPAPGGEAAWTADLESTETGVRIAAALRLLDAAARRR